MDSAHLVHLTVFFVIKHLLGNHGKHKNPIWKKFWWLIYDSKHFNSKQTQLQSWPVGGAEQDQSGVWQWEQWAGQWTTSAEHTIASMYHDLFPGHPLASSLQSSTRPSLRAYRHTDTGIEPWAMTDGETDSQWTQRFHPRVHVTSSSETSSREVP